MAGFRDRAASPRTQLWLWGIWTLVWLVLMPIAEFTILGISLRWIVFQSSFANVASCGTAWVAALSYHRARRVDEANLHTKLDALVTSHDILHGKVERLGRR